MQQRHKDRKQYFEEQGITTSKFVIPYVKDAVPLNEQARILEIGCGEGGNMVPFIELGCEVCGVDLKANQIERAKTYISETYPKAKVNLIAEDIYKIFPEEIGQFDLIMMRDVIEHIPQQDKFLRHLKTFLKKDGKVFFGFPPWRMPFGGHQQTCHNKFLSKLPYFHLLPYPLYKLVLKLGGEADSTIRSLIEIKDTRISINRFLKIVKENNYQFVKKTYYFINPNYEIKFGLKPRIQNSIIGSIPFFRDFVTTCCYSVISQK